METVAESEKSIIDIGKEFAFEGMDPSYFQGKTADEYRLFKAGYEEGIRIIQEKQIGTTEMQQNMEDMNNGIKK